MIRSYTSRSAERVGDRPATRILIDEDWCKACGICMEFCPKGILVASGHEGKPVVTDSSLCIRCMLCEARCPDFAIRVRTEGESDEDN